MPIEREHIDPVCLLMCHMPENGERHDYGEKDESYCDVETVQADQRIIGSTEQICTDRQAILIDQAIPLPRRSEEERDAQGDGAEPPVPETSDPSVSKCSH